jgi:lysozyme family protein
MSNFFDRAFDIVVGEEDGYVNDPHDPGGETKFGISKRKYPNVDIKNLTKDGAKVIFKVDYWDVVSGDQLPWPLCLYVFDSAVNQGCGKVDGYPTERMLQRALSVPQDGIIGRTTIARAITSTALTWHRFMAYRAMRYMSTRNFDRYGEGWLIRLFNVVSKA